MNSIADRYKNKGDLTQGSIAKHLIRLTLPMTWGIFIIISFQLVDMFYVSILGTKYLAALSLAFPVSFTIFSVFIGFQIAMSSVGARLIGQGERLVMRRVLSHALIFVFIVGVGLGLIGIAFHDVIFDMVGADDVTRPLIRDYMMYWFAGACFMVVSMVGNSAMRADGDTMSPAMIMTIFASLNMILDPILIFGYLGFPRLEMQGAAIATVLSNFLGMLVTLYVLAHKKKLSSHIDAFDFSMFGNSIKRLCIIAVPAGLTNAITPLVNGYILFLLANYGREAVAAYGVVTRIEGFAFVILMALATGLSPVVGQNWGAEKMNRVQESLKLAIAFSVFWSLFVAGLLYLSAENVAAIFSSDQTVIAYSVLFFMIVPVSYVFSNLVVGWVSAFNAIGRPHYSFMMIFLKMLVFLVPAVYIGHVYYGIKGIFFAIALVNFCAGSAFHVLSWRSFHKKVSPTKLNIID